MIPANEKVPVVLKEEAEEEDTEEEVENTEVKETKKTKVISEKKEEKKEEKKPEETPVKKTEIPAPIVEKKEASTHTPTLEKEKPVAETKTPVSCAKTCTDKCVATDKLTIPGMIECLKECSCDRPKTETLMKEVKLSDERTFGKMTWATFFLTFFILTTLASGALGVYRKYNYVKEYQRFYKVGGGLSGLYQRLV